MQDLTERSYVTSEQCKKLSASQLKRNEIDLGKVAEKLDSVTPFSTDELSRNIITGIGANEGVNVQDIVQEMDGQSVFSYSHKRSLNAKTLASSKNVKVSADRSIDPVILFQRFLVVSQTGNLWLEDVMSYELCLYLMSLFKGKGLLRQADKPQLAEAIRNYVKIKSDSGVQQTVPVTEHNILDGGSLLHRLKWKERSTYNSIADDYASFTVENYGSATVVFDGWTKYKGLCASEAKSKVECKQGEHYRGDNIFWEKGQLLVERGKQAGTDPADHGMYEAEWM